MPGRFVNFVRRNNTLIDGVLGNLDDIRVKKNLKEALGELNQFKEERDNYNKFIRYADAISNVDMKLSDQYKKVPGFLFNEGIENTDEYKAYVDKLIKDTESVVPAPETPENKGTQSTDNPETTEAPKIQVTEDGLRQFILENPQYYKSLYEKGNIIDKTEPKSQEELYDEIYNKAGLTDPNERQWFETYKKSFDVEGHNNSLSRFVAGQYPNLVSKGNLKGSYYDMFGGIASTYGIKPQKFADTDDPLEKANPKDWVPEQVDGRWYWTADVYNRKTKTWEKQQVKPMTAEEVKNKDGANGDNLKKMSGDELGRLTYEQLMKKFNPEDVADYLDYLAPDVQKQFLSKYPNIAAEIEAEGLKGSKTGSKGRGGRGYRRKSKGTDAVKLEGVDKILGDINKVKAKNSGKKWEQFPRTDQLKIQALMNNYKKATDENLTEEEIWKLASDLEVSTGKDDVETTPKTQEDFDINDAYMQTYDDINMDSWWDDLYDNSVSEPDFQARAKYYEEFLTKLLPKLHKKVGAKLWSTFASSKAKVWNDLNNGGRFN